MSARGERLSVLFHDLTPVEAAGLMSKTRQYDMKRHVYPDGLDPAALGELIEAADKVSTNWEHRLGRDHDRLSGALRALRGEK